MDNKKKNKFFIFISYRKIALAALNDDNKILFEKNLFADDKIYFKGFENLKRFLDQNIILFEKKLDQYIEDINLLIDHDDFITLDISTIYNFEAKYIQFNQTSNYLVSINDYVIKNIDNHNLIHMIINKFIIDGKEYFSIPDKIEYKNIFFEIKFIFLKKIIIQELKKIFAKYEISIKNISYYNYVKDFKANSSDNLFEITNKLTNGLNSKEISFVKRPYQKHSFFEKFFNFFK